MKTLNSNEMASVNGGYGTWEAYEEYGFWAAALCDSYNKLKADTQK